ncbi:MAG: hypothetical protein ACRC4J_03560 [Cetobacterium sp.]
MATQSYDLDAIARQLKDSGKSHQAGEVFAEYSFARQGGAIGTLKTGLFLPAGSVVYGGMIFGQVAVASGGAATIAIKLGATDVLPAAALTAFTATSLQRLDTLSVRLAAETELTIAIAAAALTAGKFTIKLSYMQLT